MFTGIIEASATIKGINNNGSNVDFWFTSTLTPELKIDQSVAHNGVCLTIVEISGIDYRVTAVAETLKKTNLSAWKIGDRVNLERALMLGDRLDGHLVQGHVDTTAVCTEKTTLDGSWLFRFSFPAQYAALVIEKGSICINGVSLTAFDVNEHSLSVTIIPYTFEHTNFSNLEVENVVNMEFDVMGKYLLRHQSLTVVASTKKPNE